MAMGVDFTAFLKVEDFVSALFAIFCCAVSVQVNTTMDANAVWNVFIMRKYMGLVLKN